MAFSGRKPLVVCNDQIAEADDEDEAKERAQELAVQAKRTAYVLLPRWRVPGVTNAPDRVPMQ